MNKVEKIPYPFQEYVKHLIIRTPFEPLGFKLQELLKLSKRLKNPDLEEIYLEDKRIKQMMHRTIKKDFNCIDIGCHLGSMLSEIMRLANHGQHIAFEALPYKANWLKDKFPEVDIKQLALGDTTGDITFYYNASRSGFSGLAEHSKQSDSIYEITVKCDLIDNIQVPDRQIDFMKIDVEGAELKVLRGAENTLRRYSPTLLFECTRSGLNSFGFKAWEIFELLTQKHSYAIFLLKDFLEDGKPLEFEVFEQSLKYPFKAFNFLAVDKSKI